MARTLASRGRAARDRLQRLGLETHVTLPLFAGALIAAVWFFTFHLIDSERAASRAQAADSLHELLETYEAQMARSLGGINQTLNVLKYAAEQRGALGALPELDAHGLLPPGLVFNVSITDAAGRVVASNPGSPGLSAAHERYFLVHREQDTGTLFVSRTVRDAANGEWHLHFTRRLNDREGRFNGIVIVEAEPDYFTSGYERSRLGSLGMLGLLGEDGVVRALRVGDKVSWGSRLPLLPDALGMPAPAAPDGVRRFTGTRELRAYRLTAVVGLGEQEQMAWFEQRRREHLWKAGLGSVALAVIAGLLWLWIWQGAKTRRRLRRDQETYAAASQANLDAFFVLRSVRDERGRIVDFTVADANGQAEKMTGVLRQQLAAATLCTLLPQARENGVFDSLLHKTLHGGVYEEEWENHMPQLRARWLHLQVVGVEDGVVVILRDISERKEAEARILHMAHHDALTGLPNRALITQRLQQAIAHAGNNGGTVLIAFIDLDSFKLVNDGLGHNAGDELLKVVSARMTSCVRQDDTVGRFGGDEFVLILPALRDDDQAVTAVMEKIRLAVVEPLVLDGQEVQVSCSIGVAAYPRHGYDADTLLLNADAAMYRAKELGKNNYQFYTQEMNASVEEKLALLEGLRYALEDGQFRVLYQPKVDLHTGLIFGVEALVRWHHPEHGLVSPARFIPLAEESGLIVAIGEWVLRTACAQNRAWRDAGLPPLVASVNVSARQFDDPRLVARVRQALADARLDPSGLELEVTESLIMRDLQQALTRMGELQAMGLSLSIDDFGTGYSSLSTLKTFPISRLKIDKSFVSDLDASVDDQAITRAIISLAHQLQLRVIAEGVETARQRDFLRDNGCDEMQGYLFSRPVTAEEIAVMLERQVARAA